LFRWLYRISDGIRHRARQKRWDAAQALGRRGEDLAHRLLQDIGMTVVARNFRTPTGSGELDIVARDGDELVVVEVKSRTNTEFGTPERNLDWKKEQRVIRGAEEFARRSDVPLSKVRFDVVTVVFSDPPEVKHRKAAFHPRQLV
jgi:putative endonuclease